MVIFRAILYVIALDRETRIIPLRGETTADEMPVDLQETRSKAEIWMLRLFVSNHLKRSKRSGWPQQDSSEVKKGIGSSLRV